MAEPGQGAEMSEAEFHRLCVKASEGKTAEVLAAVDQDRRLATRACAGNGYTLLMWACHDSHDNPQLAQGLLERGANVHARSNGGNDALMWASANGHIAVCTVLLGRGADPDSKQRSGGQEYSALLLAALYDHLQVCLLLISRRANLMLVVDGRTALSCYGDRKRPALTPDLLEQRRATLLTAFEQGPHPDACWARRCPMMSVMAGCGFRPLAVRLLEQEMHLAAFVASCAAPPPPAPIALETPQQRRAFYMRLIFRSDFLLRRIVPFL